MGKKSKSKEKKEQTPSGNAARRYAGAMMGAGVSDWVAQSTSADTEIWSSLRTLRDRSRSLARDNDYAVGAIRSILTNVLGSNGIKMKPKVKDKSGNFDDLINKEIKDLWEIWQNPEYCDVSGRQSWPQIERLALRSVIESGEVLIRLVRKRFSNSPVPFALQVIESDQLADNYSFGLKVEGTNTVKMGVELNEWQRPVAYWIYPYHPGDHLTTAGQQQKNRYQPIRVPADEIIHLFVSDRPMQTRGVPWLSTAISRLRGMGEYTEAEIVKVRAHACAMGFIESAMPEVVGMDAGPQQKRQISFQAGTIHSLGQGEKFTGFAPTSPTTGLDPFLRFLLRGVSAGIGVPADAVSQDYSQTTYGGQRASMLDARDHWAVLQKWLSSALHQHVFEGWLEAALMSGAIALPDYELRYREYTRPTWMPRGWSWIDPSKDVTASVRAVKAGLSTIGRELAAQGIDFDELLAERIREVKMVQAAEIQYESMLETLIPAPPQTAQLPSSQIKPSSTSSPRAMSIEPAPDEVVQAPDEVVQAPDEVVQAPDEVVQAPDEVVEPEPDEVVEPEPDEVVQAPDEVVQAPDEVVEPEPDEVVEPEPDEVVEPTPDEMVEPEPEEDV
jgi:lambda family phage portal protein